MVCVEGPSALFCLMGEWAQISKHVRVVVGLSRCRCTTVLVLGLHVALMQCSGRTRSRRTETACPCQSCIFYSRLAYPQNLHSFLHSTLMQSAAGLKKRSPFTFTSDEDSSLADAGILDDQRKFPCAWSTPSTSFSPSDVVSQSRRRLYKR